MTIAAIIQGVIGAAGAVQKGVASAKQKKMAKGYEKTQRPDYQIPPSLQKATDMARANLNPEINKQLLQEIAANSATAINRAGKVGTSTADMLAAIGGINANENAAKRQFFGDNQQRKDAMLGQYLNQLGAMGGQENKAWEWNKAQPYLNAQEAAQALNQSSAQNAAGALGDLAAGVGGGAKSLMMGKQMDLQGDQMKQMMELLGYGGTDATKSGLSDAQKLAEKATSLTGKYGDNVQSLGQKGLAPLIKGADKPLGDPNAPYMPNDADLLGLSKDALLSSKTAPVSEYENWKAKLPANLQNETDYDLQQLYKDNPSAEPTANLHLDSKYKKPNHITFSDESIHSNEKTKGGKWERVNGVWNYTPSDYVLSQHTPEELQDYFKREEKDAILNLPPKNTDANIPPAIQIATNPTTPTIATTTTGKIMENGKPMDYRAAEKLIGNDIAFNDASGKIPYKTTENYALNKTIEEGKRKLMKNRTSDVFSILKLLNQNPALAQEIFK